MPVHWKVLESQTVCEAAQSWQALPWVPQVVLFPLAGFFTHALSLQQPSQFDELHCCGPHDGVMAAKKPRAAPRARA
jgi:hypothetical protein